MGATGVVGRKLLEILESENINGDKINLYASKRSAGKLIRYKDKYLTVKSEIDEKKLKKGLFVLCVDKEVSRTLVPMLLNNNQYVIDCSTEYRNNENIPLIAAYVNEKEIKDCKLICNPNCVVLQIIIPIKIIKEKYEIERIDVVSFQSVSGSGKKGIDDLLNKTNNFYPYKINKTCIPLVGNIKQNNYSTEEEKIRLEIRKILKDNKLKINATCVRVPVEYCHGIALSLTLQKECDVEVIKNILSNNENIKYQEIPNGEDAINNDYVYVGRIRKDLDNPNIVHMYIVGNNLRRGAASNAYWIMKEILKKV